MRVAALALLFALAWAGPALGAEISISVDPQCERLDTATIRRVFLAELLEDESSHDVEIACPDDALLITLLGDPTLHRRVQRGEHVERVVAMVLVELREERRYASKDAAKAPKKEQERPTTTPTPAERPAPPGDLPTPVTPDHSGLYVGVMTGLIWPPRAMAWGAMLEFHHWPASRWGWAAGVQLLTREDPTLRGSLRSVWTSASGWLLQEIASPGPWRITWGIGGRIGAQTLMLESSLNHRTESQIQVALWGGPLLGTSLWRSFGDFAALGLQLEVGLSLRELNVRIPPSELLEFDGPWATMALGVRIM